MEDPILGMTVPFLCVVTWPGVSVFYDFDIKISQTISGSTEMHRFMVLLGRSTKQVANWVSSVVEERGMILNSSHR